MTATVADRSTGVAELTRRLVGLLGERAVRTDLKARERASIDGATMSPVLMEQHPLGLADLVVFPTTTDEVCAVIAAAVECGVPVTPRGKGTGNYAQAIPMHNGLVLDMSRATTVHGIETGSVTADAGAKLMTLETAAWETGQQLWMYPSTVHSTLGGFLGGGSCGTGSIRHGNNDMGFVAALDVVTATTPPTVLRLTGDDTTPYVHTYGVAGIITKARVRLEPLQPWRVVWSTFADVRQGLGVFREISRIEPRARLVSLDDARLASALPTDDALPAGRASLRAVVDEAVLDEVTGMVRAAGGRVEDVREGLQAVLAASMLSYNHPTWWLMKAAPGEFVHVEAIGDAVADRYDEARTVFEDSSLHFEAGYREPFVLVNGRYQGADQVSGAIATLESLGIRVHNPHQWYVDHNVEQIRELSAVNDPRSLLNPGKLRPPPP